MQNRPSNINLCRCRRGTCASALEHPVVFFKRYGPPGPTGVFQKTTRFAPEKIVWRSSDDMENRSKNPAFFTACFVYNEWPTGFLHFCWQRSSWQLWNWTLRLVTSPPKKVEAKNPNFHVFSKVGNRTAKFFHPKPRQNFESPDSPTLPLESPEFAGPTWRQLGWLVFWSTFLKQRHFLQRKSMKNGCLWMKQSMCLDGWMA